MQFEGYMWTSRSLLLEIRLYFLKLWYCCFYHTQPNSQN